MMIKSQDENDPAQELNILVNELGENLEWKICDQTQISQLMF